MSHFGDTAQRLARVAPQLRPAGIAGDYSQPGVAELTSSYNPAGRTTPDHIRSFHHRGPEVGQARLPRVNTKEGETAVVVDPNQCFGIKSKHEGGTEVCLRPGLYADRMTTILDEQRERRYLSALRQPLGQTPAPKTPIPVPLHGFGITRPASESVKSVMSCWRDVDPLHPAGVQLDRHYDWESKGIDPVHHRFGIAHPKSESSLLAQAAVQPIGATVLQPKIVVDYRATTECELGRSKRYGFDDPATWDATKRKTADPRHTRPTAMNGFESEQPSVRELLSTWAGPPEATVAAAAKENTTINAAAEAIAAQEMSDVQRVNKDDNSTSVQDAHGLGDEVTAQQLVQPCHYVSLGVQSKYFAGGRPREEIRRLCHKVGFGLSDAQIDEVFDATAESGMCGIEQFKNAATAKGYM